MTQQRPPTLATRQAMVMRATRETTARARTTRKIKSKKVRTRVELLAARTTNYHSAVLVRCSTSSLPKNANSAASASSSTTSASTLRKAAERI